mgnify:CR=1 FL=1
MNITIQPETKSVSGYNDITYKWVKPSKRIQIDLFENMQVDSIVLQKSKLSYTRELDAVFIDIPNELQAIAEPTLRFYYSGTPLVAKNAPWDGGFVWKKDSNGKIIYKLETKIIEN